MASLNSSETRKKGFRLEDVTEVCVDVGGSLHAAVAIPVRRPQLIIVRVATHLQRPLRGRKALDCGRRCMNCVYYTDEIRLSLARPAVLSLHS